MKNIFIKYIKLRISILSPKVDLVPKILFFLNATFLFFVNCDMKSYINRCVSTINIHRCISVHTIILTIYDINKEKFIDDCYKNREGIITHNLLQEHENC